MITGGDYPAFDVINPLSRGFEDTKLGMFHPALHIIIYTLNLILCGAGEKIVLGAKPIGPDDAEHKPLEKQLLGFIQGEDSHEFSRAMLEFQH